ncbi:hypothetical protein [Candidatus Marithrix sp. Canyon 246]|uniref:hypothetical protein n=1 Tax=Candidatus Marithrix sp. Canyon 246 TaxID=1827136 RepID=UPI00114D1F73|nr:hypothetical protein [Candidatus Marithrix sp. Canyon 246]
MKNNHIITSVLIILFLIKPTIDLTWTFRVSLPGISISPLHVAGLFVLIFFGIQYLKNTDITAPYAIIFAIFIIVNIISVIIGLFFYKFTIMGIMDIMIRILDSYIIYNVAFLAGTLDRNINYNKLIKAIMIGSSIAVIINLIAIKLGYGGIKDGAASINSDLRESGLYFDAGGMSNVALFNIIFTVLFLHLLEKKTKIIKKLFWYIFCLTIIVICVYVIFLGLSRSVMLQLVLFTFCYILLVQKAAGKIVLSSLIVIVVMGGLIQGSTYDRLLARFQGDMQVFEESEEDVVEETEGVSLGKYEQLGNNRGKNWALALNSLIDRTVIEMILGNFRGTAAHSDYLDVLSRNGIIGLILYLSLLFGLFSKTLALTLIGRTGEQHDMIHIWAWMLITLYIVYALPFRPLMYTTTAWYMWAMLGFSMALAEGGSKSSSMNEYSTVNNILSKRKVILSIRLPKKKPLLIIRNGVMDSKKLNREYG